MADVKDFILPDLGEGLTEGEIVSWLVAVGDAIVVDQPVAEIQTAKAVVEVPSPFAGVVTTLHGEVGEEVEVGKPLLSVDVAPDASGGRAAPEAGDAATPEGDVGVPPEDAEVAEMVPEPEPTPEADDGGSGNVLVGYGTGGGGGRRRRRGRAKTGPSGQPAQSNRPLAKPPVRRLAKDLGVDLSEVGGSGPGGRVLREDVEAAANGHPRAGADASARGATASAVAPAAPAPRAAEAQPPAKSERPPAEDHDVERVPVRGVRKIISANMTRSRQEIPDATSWVDVDATGLMELRERLNARRDDVRITPLAIVLRAVVAGIREIPVVNARLDVEAQEIVIPRSVHLGFAAQTDSGLVVPVIKHAERRSLYGIATELRRLAVAARERRASPEEMSGGTFTVSNYGSFGVDGGSPIINPGEAAILGVGRVIDKPWVVDGAVVPRKVMQLSIAFDHRICDGGEAAGFLRFVADCIEDPDVLLGAL